MALADQDEWSKACGLVLWDYKLIHLYWETYLGPADMTGQLSSVQKSVMVPYSMLIWLKKSTAVKKEKDRIQIKFT